MLLIVRLRCFPLAEESFASHSCLILKSTTAARTRKSAACSYFRQSAARGRLFGSTTKTWRMKELMWRVLTVSKKAHDKNRIKDKTHLFQEVFCRRRDMLPELVWKVQSGISFVRENLQS